MVVDEKDPPKLDYAGPGHGPTHPMAEWMLFLILLAFLLGWAVFLFWAIAL